MDLEFERRLDSQVVSLSAGEGDHDVAVGRSGVKDIETEAHQVLNSVLSMILLEGEVGGKE